MSGKSISISDAEAKQLTRFQFGENWARFLSRLDDQQIRHAEICLKRMLEVEDLRGRSFIDVGAGSGLSSLAARRMGASVFSFDCDPQSLWCAQSLKQQFCPEDPKWMIAAGSILDAAWLRSLEQYDIVYSWGVLHHTGAMWQALANIDSLVAPRGKLFIAIYNDQGRVSDFWREIKRLYNRLPQRLGFLLTWPALIFLWGPRTLKDLFHGRPFHTWRTYAKSRGMSPWHDLVDWVGGYPFEVAKPEAIIEFFVKRGFELQKLNACGRQLGCNEFVFTKL
ncbi:MAG TPA: class I SAM-dependent methyltransferase [Pyrinomonadaceae bacterium]|nr:class I SAM-dependent methyltransferase [Pyrinomonadaceae bacterium]